MGVMAGIAGLLGLGEGAGKAIATPVAAVGNVIDQLFTSDDERLSHEEIRLRLNQQPHLAQVEINKIEAAHRTIFVAGWRPSIGWVCSACLALYYIPQCIVSAWVWTKLCLVAIERADTLSGFALPAYPMGIEGILELVLAMLGMAGLRTFEKLKGRAK